MISTEADRAKQLLVIRFVQRVTVVEAEASVLRVEQCLLDLNAGFSVLTDLSDLDTMEEGCAAFISRIMDLCNAKGVDTVFRIVSDPARDIGFSVMSLFHYDPAVKIVTFSSHEEAAQTLADLG